MEKTELPGGLTGFLVRRFVPRPTDLRSATTRAAYGYLGGSVSSVVNLILAAIKITLGFWIGSKALIADGLHSGSDMLTSVVVIFGFWMAKQPSDEEHPFGHANAELVAGLIMSILLIIAGFELLRDNVIDLIHQDFSHIETSWPLLLTVSLTIVIKEWLFVFSKSLSKVIISPALDADAWHHRMDSLTTLAVVIGLLASMMGFPWMDPTIGVVVSLMVIWSGVEIAKDSISPLLGENVGKPIIQEILDLALMSKEIHNAHDIYVHTYGQTYFVSMHVEIQGSLTPIEMHDVAAQVQGRVEGRFGGACTIHVDPVDIENHRYQEISVVLHQLIKSHHQLLDFHDLQFRTQDGKEAVFFELSVAPEIIASKYPDLHIELERELKEENTFAETNLHFTLEPGYNLGH